MFKSFFKAKDIKTQLLEEDIRNLSSEHPEHDWFHKSGYFLASSIISVVYISFRVSLGSPEFIIISEIMRAIFAGYIVVNVLLLGLYLIFNKVNGSLGNPNFLFGSSKETRKKRNVLLLSFKIAIVFEVIFDLLYLV